MKPPSKRGKRDRYAFHFCWHHDAWDGIMLMPPDQVGVYWRIILLMYKRRSALPNNDVELAQLCHVSTRAFRRIKAALVEAGRIVVEEDTGLLYDQRAIVELIGAERYSEAQAQRAKNRWKGKPAKPRLAVDNDPKCPMIDPIKADKVGGYLAPLAEIVENFECRTDANQKPKEETLTETPAPRAAMPPLRAGGAQPRSEDDREKWLADQRRRMLADDEQEALTESSDGESEPKPAGDRKAVRS